MQESGWRYHPEFIVRVLINGQDSGEAVALSPAPASARALSNYGLLLRPSPGGILGFVRQHLVGTDWIPVVDFEESDVFAFWLVIRQGTEFQSLDFFSDASQTFGRHIFYANNLSGTGVIDDNLSGSVVSLTEDPTAGDTERGSLSPYLLSTNVVPGAFSALEAGKIEAGGPVTFSISEPVAPTQSTVGLDFSLRQKGSYMMRLQGASPIVEPVVFDEDAARAQVSGIVEIYKDAWQIEAQPREYRIDFSST